MFDVECVACLYSMQYTLYSVQYVFWNLQCAVVRKHLISVLCKVNSVHFAGPNVCCRWNKSLRDTATDLAANWVNIFNCLANIYMLLSHNCKNQMITSGTTHIIIRHYEYKNSIQNMYTLDMKTIHYNTILNVSLLNIQETQI